MVAIVVHQHRRTGFTVHGIQREFTEEIETTPGALEAFQCAQNRIVINAFFRRDGHCRCGIERVMAPWRIQRHVQQLFVLTRQREVSLRANLFVLFHADVSVFAEAVGGDLTTHARQQLADHRIVHAHHRAPVERQVVQEVDKGLL